MNDPLDPFGESRKAGPIVECKFNNLTIPMILRHKDLRNAARDWVFFSSDAPFRVPIPSEESVRTVRQLPIETDPPEHTEYRKIVEPFFNQPRNADMQEKLGKVVWKLIQSALQKDSIEVVGEMALPLQSKSLALLLKVPEEEADEWIGWGVNVLKDSELSAKKGAALEAYIREKLDHAKIGPGSDFFSTLTQARFSGRPLTQEEMMGFCNLVFAGGRDTVIHSISSIVSYFAEYKDRLAELRENPRLIMTATEEFMRYFSPLTHIGRVCSQSGDLDGHAVEDNQSVSLCWASANRDASVFKNPEEVILDRKPNPHLAFGSGPHSCLGALHARTLIRVFISTLSQTTDKVTVSKARPNIEAIGQFERQIGYDRLEATFHPLDA